MNLIDKIDDTAKKIMEILKRYPNLSYKELDELRIHMNLCSNYLSGYLYEKRINGGLEDN